MDCNKDEAFRAKVIAENRLVAKNMTAAKKFALKAQSLYPGLEGMPQLMATIDVYVAADNKVNGEIDWYGILGVHPQANDDTVRKQYRKLALLLHPDKNKYTEADGAFKLVSQAWSLLSDRGRRAAYDQNRNKKLPRKVSTPSGFFPKKPGSNDSPHLAKSSGKVHKNTHATAAKPASSHRSKPNTFWTVCHRCKMQYEYLRIYLNHNLLCPNCREPFLAVETAPPPINSRKATISQCKQQSTNESLNFASPDANSGGFGVSCSQSPTNFQWSPFSSTGGTSTVAKAASLVQQAYAKVKRQREEAQAASKREEALKRKNNASKRMDSGCPGGSRISSKRRKGADGVRLDDFSSSFSNPNGTVTGKSNEIAETYDAQDVQLGIQTSLLQKAKVTIHRKLSDWSSLKVKTRMKEGIRNEMAVDQGEKPSLNAEVHNCGSMSASEIGDCAVKSYTRSSGSGMESETLRTVSMEVTNSEFYNFDRNRTEKCFGENQVWAAYDNDDGMPRYYAFIHGVISLDPIKIRISWLTSKISSNLGSLHWVTSGFSQACGDFLPRRFKMYGSLDSFSHKVRWTKGQNGIIRIYPRKGEVWALYRNWSPFWNELTTDDVIHKYELVEVLEDYSEEDGVTIVPLVKVAGFKTIFHCHINPREVRSICGEELFRFSHQVPSHLLTGREGPDAPEGCRELDPAATPADFLRVILHGNGDRCLVDGGNCQM